MCFREGGQQTERQKKIGDTAGVIHRDVVLDDIAVRGSKAGNRSRDQTRVVCDGRARVRDLHRAAVGDGLEQAQEGNLMRGETRISGRCASDFGDMNWSTSESGEDQSLRKGPVS